MKGWGFGTAVRTASVLLAAFMLVSGCSSTANPTASPVPGGPSAGSLGAASLPAGSHDPAPTLGPGVSPAPDATQTDDATPATGATPGATSESRATPTPAAGNGGTALPACAYQDQPARGNPDHDWTTMVLDTIYRLPADFVPKHLVSTSKAGMNGGAQVIEDVIDDLREMHRDSARDEAEIAVRWAYRSYGQQAGAFAFWVRTSGRQEALRLSARPGHSEHQLGTTVDFRSADSDLPPWDYDDWATTAPGAWMAQHAWRYGFVLSYPKGEQSETCYGYEPWHYRYVGRDIARDIHESGQTERRYLWEHYLEAGKP